jgi:hypothetical protein
MREWGVPFAEVFLSTVLNVKDSPPGSRNRVKEKIVGEKMVSSSRQIQC